MSVQGTGTIKLETIGTENHFMLSDYTSVDAAYSLVKKLHLESQVKQK